MRLSGDPAGDAVSRPYESRGGHGGGAARTGFPLAGALAAELLEKPPRDADLDGDETVPAGLRPFRTLVVPLRRTAGR